MATDTCVKFAGYIVTGNIFGNCECDGDDTWSNNTITLYHATSSSAGDSIERSGRMHPGTRGKFGGGIYFARSESEARYKSNHGSGAIVKARVRMGRIKRINDPYSGYHNNISYRGLKNKGYDSVIGQMRSGNEYVVYNPDQVKVVGVYRR